MNKIIFGCCLLLMSCTIFGQPLSEPLKTKYRQAKTSKQKAEVILDIERPSSADSVKLAQIDALREWCLKNNDTQGARYAGLFLASANMFKGDGNITLKMAFPILKAFEKDEDEYGVMRCHHIIGAAYSISKDFKLFYEYLGKALVISEKNNYENFSTIVYNDLGVGYYEDSQPEKGLLYAQKALYIDTKNKDSMRLPVSLSTVGENYMEAKSYDLAMPFLLRSYKLLKKNRQQNTYMDIYIHNDLAQAYLGLKKLDSAAYFARIAIEKTFVSDFREQRLRSYQYLIEIFKLMRQQDSLNKYYPLMIQTKDELFDLEKLRSIEDINFDEQLRQKEIETEKAKAEEERRHLIQYAVIATGIITFFILFLLLSRTIIVNEKWISFLAILALLLIFEFINLLIHPFLEKVTHHSPILMLLCLVVLASMLIPLHHKLEHVIKHKLTEKNKAIRLAAAKKTLEELENN